MSACKGVGYGGGFGGGFGGAFTSTGVILVLFILLVIISRTFFI
ncbi:YjcZ family sporulation protein [Paenibacillus jiagnxiensis]